MIHFRMANVQSRRNFIRLAPLAAAALVPVSASSLGQTLSEPNGGFEVFPKQTVDGLVTALEASPAAKDIVSGKGTALSMTLSAEAAKIAKEFEMHEHRDHVFQVLDGSTTYQIGGKLEQQRQTRPGEWLAPASAGFRTITLNKGDLLSIPRGTPHRRMTEGKVSLLLITGTS